MIKCFSLEERSSETQPECMVEGIDHGLAEKRFQQDLSQFLFVLVKDLLGWQTFMVGDNFAAETKTFLVVGEKKQFVSGMIVYQISHPGGDCDGAEACPGKELDQKVFTEAAVGQALFIFNSLVAELFKDQGTEDATASLQELGFV